MTLKAHVWRRGRGVQVWNFLYVTHGNKAWFSSPGWYHFTNRKHVYRITIDHDYRNKPLWLGRLEGGKWNNTEGLYEPLMVVHKDFVISNRGYPGRGKYRSSHRISFSRRYIERKTARIIEDARRQAG